ncbi:MAG: leucine-rich repeat protein [Eubacterium sp.]|nr:leucine-rich repeat protein [Eubacterium sp.]
MKRIKQITILCLFISVLGFCGLYHSVVNAEESESFDEFTVYYSNYEDIFTVPEEYFSHKITIPGVTGNVTYKVKDSFYWADECQTKIEVSDDGVVTPKKVTFYKSGNSWIEKYIAGAETKQEYKRTTATVYAYCGDETYTITVYVNDYANIYADKRAQEIVDEVITDGMTQSEKLMAFVKYIVNNFDYSEEASDATGMLVFGSGDCWAHDDLMQKLCGLVGIKSHSYNPIRTHIDTIVECDGHTYEIDTSYSGSRPRSYYIRELYNGFSTYWYQDGIECELYMGFNENVVVPKTVEDRTVLALGTESENYSPEVFYDAAVRFGVVVKTVSIPSSVQIISSKAFNNCPDITDIFVDEDNDYFCDINGVLYSKDKKTLLAYPEGRSDVIINSGTKIIGKNAFNSDRNISQLEIPDSVTTIREGAFAECANLICVTIGKNVKTIESHAFERTESKIIIKSTDVQIEDKAISSNAIIYGYKGSTAETYALTNGNEFRELTEGQIVSVQVDGQSSLKLNQGDTAKLKVQTFPRGAQGEIIWKSSDNNIVTVNEGNIKCVKYGKAEISAYITGYEDEAACFTIESYAKREIPDIPVVEEVTCTSITFVNPGQVYVIGDNHWYITDISGLEPDTEYTVYSYNPGSGEYLLDSDYTDCITVRTKKGKRIDEKLIPDPILRIYVRNYVDIVHDGFLSEEEISDTTKINISDFLTDFQGTDIKFDELKGIELFYNLEELNISYNSLVNVDLSNNKKLKKLLCDDNSFTKLDLSNNTELEFLSCENNNLSGELDLSSNTKMKTLYCKGNNLTKVLMNTDSDYIYLSIDDVVSVINKGNVISENVVNTPDPDDNFSNLSEPTEIPEEASTPKKATNEKSSTEEETYPTPSTLPVLPTSTPTVTPNNGSVKDKITTFSIKNKDKIKASAKIKIKDKDKIKKITLNGKTIKVKKNKTSFTLKLKSYKKKLKKKGKWNTLKVTDKKGNVKTIKFKTK